MDRQLLDFALENGILEETYIQAQVDMIKRKELLEKYPYSYWQGSDGKWYTHIYQDGKRSLRKRSTKREIEDLILDKVKIELDDPTIAEVFYEWNDWRLEHEKISPASHKRYKNVFEKYYHDFGQNKIKDICPEDVLDFLEEQTGMTAKSFGNLKTITKGMMKRAKRRKLINWNIEEVFYDVEVSFKRRIKTDSEEVFNEEEWDKMVDYLTSHQDTMNLGILLLFVTGMRVGELAALKPCDIHDDNTIFVNRTESCYLNEDGKYSYCVKNFPKTEAGARTIIIPDEYVWLIKKLRLLNPFGEYLFERDGERIKEQGFRRRLTRVCNKVGVTPRSPHKIRKTYGTILLDNNVDQRFILDQMGHTKISTTEDHYHRSRRNVDKKRAVLNRLPEFCL